MYVTSTGRVGFRVADSGHLYLGRAVTAYARGVGCLNASVVVVHYECINAHMALCTNDMKASQDGCNNVMWDTYSHCLRELADGNDPTQKSFPKMSLRLINACIPKQPVLGCKRSIKVGAP